ncbi:hypothetical protein Baya_9951 [Bagarius yarrelli]|uniref:Uncharacterized protein n=1 Tax=Bagarius yarrelli TaxID=175774 RepID=A0A556U822_BAGYA|nr:hypothetical protein Baya_9951 [Bagarius yarrelli]
MLQLPSKCTPRTHTVLTHSMIDHTHQFRVGPWGRIACLAHNVIGSHPGECDCCAEPPPGTVALLFRPVDTLNAVREPRQNPGAILSGGFVLSSGSSASTKHQRTELAI